MKKKFSAVIDQNVYFPQGGAKEYKISRLPKEYTVKVTRYKPNVSGISDQLNVRIVKFDMPIVTFDRNYHTMCESVYLKQKNKEYIITSGNYQAITIVNLTDKKVNSYVTSEKAFKMGYAFCPCKFEYDSEADTLTITGCIWSGPEESYTYQHVDFSNPDFSYASACKHAFLEEENYDE